MADQGPAGQSITRKTFAEPEDELRYEHGRASLVTLGDETVWRSELSPGWSWDAEIAPHVGARSCPLTHREYVESGRVRYLMDDGAEVEAGAGDVMLIKPGHRAWVLGDEPCVLIDW